MSSSIGDKLLQLRTNRNETQEMVAESVGISYVSLSRYETGQRMPKMDILIRLADHYGVTVDEIFGRAPGELNIKTLSPEEQRIHEAAAIMLSGVNASEADLVRLYRQLNQPGQLELMKYAEYLTARPDYQAEPPAASAS